MFLQHLHQSRHPYKQNNYEKITTRSASEHQHRELRRRLGLLNEEPPRFILRQVRIIEAVNLSTGKPENKLHFDNVGTVVLSKGLNIHINSTVLEQELLIRDRGAFKSFLANDIHDT